MFRLNVGAVILMAAMFVWCWSNHFNHEAAAALAGISLIGLLIYIEAIKIELLRANEKAVTILAGLMTQAGRKPSDGKGDDGAGNLDELKRQIRQMEELYALDKVKH